MLCISYYTPTQPNFLLDLLNQNLYGFLLLAIMGYLIGYYPTQQKQPKKLDRVIKIIYFKLSESYQDIYTDGLSSQRKEALSEFDILPCFFSGDIHRFLRIRSQEGEMLRYKLLLRS